MNVLIIVPQSVRSHRRSMHFWCTPAANSKDNNDMTAKDGTSVLNQSEQAVVPQSDRSYPFEPGSRKQDFAVDGHYRLHFAYSSLGADSLRFICLIFCPSLLFWLRKFTRHLSEVSWFPRVLNSQWIRFDALALCIRYINALLTYFIDHDFKDWTYWHESIRISSMALLFLADNL